jgi:hypothetical protein
MCSEGGSGSGCSVMKGLVGGKRKDSIGLHIHATDSFVVLLLVKTQ